MKSNLLYPLIAILFISLLSFCPSIDSTNIVSIQASTYTESTKIPQWTNSFNITLYKMRHSNLLDDSIISKETHVVKNRIYHFIPDTGRYIIYVSKDELSGSIDFNYQGGDISLTLLMK